MYFRPVGGARRWISARLPRESLNLAAKRVIAEMHDRLRARGGRATVLVIGGSKIGAGVRVLLADPNLEVIETDVAWGQRTQMICDGHDLPFHDGSIDAVVIQAVLGYVVDPQRCVAEIHRVLKSDGLVFADTPFTQQVVGREYDFTRFTRLGHRRLFRQFREHSTGMTSGPGTALAWSGKYFLTSFAQEGHAGCPQRTGPRGLLLAQVFRLSPGKPRRGLRCGRIVLFPGREVVRNSRRPNAAPRVPGRTLGVIQTTSPNPGPCA